MKTVLLGSGALLLVAAVAANAVIGRFVRLETDPRAAPGLLELSRVGLEVGGQRGSGRERRISVRVAYPEEMRENEAASVELRYDEERSPGGEPQPPISAAAELSSPAFEISPAQRIERRGVPPLTFTWVVKPESEGRYALLLDLQPLLRRDALEVVAEGVTLNGRQAAMPEGDSLLLRTHVFTVWGVSGKTFGVLRGGVGFLGFILMYPLWIPWLQRRLRRSLARSG